MSPRGTPQGAPRRRRLPIVALIGALVGAAVAFAVVPPRYRATGTALLTAPRAQADNDGITVNPYGDLGTATTRLATLVATVGTGDTVHTAVTAGGGHSSYSVSADLRTPLLTVSATGSSAADAVRTTDLVLAKLGQSFVALQSGSGVPATQQFTLHSVSTPTSASTLLLRRILSSLLVLAVLLVVGLGVCVIAIKRAARLPVPVLPRRSLRDRLPRREPAAIRRPVQLGGHAGGLSSVAPAVGHRWEAPLDDTFAEGGRLPLLVPGEDEQQLDDLLEEALVEAGADAPNGYLNRPPTNRAPTPADTVTVDDVVAEPAIVDAVVTEPVGIEPVVIEPASVEPAPAAPVVAAPAAKLPVPPTKPARTRASRRVSAIGYEGRAEPLPVEAAFLEPARSEPLVEVAEAPAPEIAAHPLGGALLTVTGPLEVTPPAPPATPPEPALVLPTGDPEPAAAEPAVVLPAPPPAPAVRALRGQQPQARHRSESPSTRTRRRPASGTASSSPTTEEKASGPKTPRASRAKAAQTQNGTGAVVSGTTASRTRRADIAARDE